MTKNPKSKKNFIGNLKKMILPGETYIFPNNTKMKLYYFGEVVENSMIAIEHIRGNNAKNGFINIFTEVDSIHDWDDLMTFSYSEIKSIYNFICEDYKKAVTEGRIIKG